MIRRHAFAAERICEVLAPYLSEERSERIHRVVAARTRSVVTVVEGISNYGNVSAVMRTAEALGFFEVHVITGDHAYKQSRRTSQGAEKWLDIGVWDRPSECVDYLRDRGYQIAVTDASPEALPLASVDFCRKTAIVLGNEMEGVSAEIRPVADIICRIDMAGFVESYNISVAAGLILYHAYSSRLRQTGRNGDLDEAERRTLQARYYLRAVQRAEDIVLEQMRRSENGG